MFFYPMLPDSLYFMYNSIYFSDNIDLVVEFVIPLPIIIAITMSLIRNLVKNSNAVKTDKKATYRTVGIAVSYVLLVTPAQLLTSIFIVHFPYCRNFMNLREFEKVYYVFGFLFPVVNATKSVIMHLLFSTK